MVFLSDGAQTLRKCGDLLGRAWYAEQVIEALSRTQPKHPKMAPMCGTCVNAVCGATERILEQVSETFADYFVDVS